MPWPTCPRGSRDGVAAAIRQAFLQPDGEPAPARPRATSPTSSGPRWPKLAAFMDDSEHDVLAYMDFPAQHRTKLHSHQPAGTSEQGGQAPRRCRRHLPQRAVHHPPDRCRPARAQRRVAAPAPLHADRGRNGRHMPPLTLVPSQIATVGRMTNGHLNSTRISTTLTDVTRGS